METAEAAMVGMLAVPVDAAEVEVPVTVTVTVDTTVTVRAAPVPVGADDDTSNGVAEAVPETNAPGVAKLELDEDTDRETEDADAVTADAGGVARVDALVLGMGLTPTDVITWRLLRWIVEAAAAAPLAAAELAFDAGGAEVTAGESRRIVVAAWLWTTGTAGVDGVAVTDEAREADGAMAFGLAELPVDDSGPLLAATLATGRGIDPEDVAEMEAGTELAAALA